MKEMEFNLLEEPWVRVLLEDYTVREVSLKDALLNAEQYIDLAGEVPTQDIAVLRLLLAILHPGMRQPGVVRWIVRLQRERILARENIVRFRIAAIEYGDKDFFVTDTFGDSLAFHLLLLDELSARWRAAVAEEVGRCEQLAAQLGYLAQKLALAAGGEKKAAPEDVKQRFYFQIDQLFRDWLESIEPSWKGEEEINCIRQWQEKAQQVARTLGIQLVLEAGTVAFAGRGLSEKIGKGQSGKEIKQYYSAPKAFNDFLWKIKRIYQDPQ